MNRLDRVTAILIQLQSKKIVKAQEIAGRFKISLRTVYRDIKTLEEAGIPLYGETGVGYSIMEGYRLPPVMFTKEEATAFLTAEKMIEKLTDSSTEESYKSAMYKIRAVLRSTEKDYLETLDDQIEVVKSRRQVQATPVDAILQPILKCISGKRVIRLHYFVPYTQEQTVREIEPVGIYYLDTYWHLIAYCRLRKDYRDFRVDRIKELNPTEETFQKNHPTLKAYLLKQAKERNLFTITIVIDRSISPYIDEQKYYHGFVSQKFIRDKIEMNFLTESIEGFARWYLMFGDHAEIIAPTILKGRIHQILEEMMTRLSELNQS